MSPVAQISNPRRSQASGGGLAEVRSHSLLRAGSSGPEVKQLQNLLKRAGLLEGNASGKFDAKTEAAVRAYQKEKGLQVDGLVGQQTWGSFFGVDLPPGTQNLKSGGVSSAGGPGGARGINTDGFDDVPTGPSKTVTAYVNGSPRQIQVASMGNGEYLRADAARAFKSMQDAARRDGVNLGLTSGFRTMAEQQALYQKYLNGTGNLAARPGYSNHQNGIAVDISGVNGRGTAADSWLRQNASRFGFRNLPSEYWHYDFVG